MCWTCEMERVIPTLILLTLSLGCATSSQPRTVLSDNTTDRPIIGILSVPLEAGGCITLTQDQTSTNATSCFHSIYVKWIESSGARVVPIPYDLPQDQLSSLVESLNGVLFTGGETPIFELESAYMNAARFILDHAVQSTDYFPIWGSCMGMQTLSLLVAQNASVLESNQFHGVDPKMLPLTLTGEAANSRLLGMDSMPAGVRWIISHSPVTTNLHHDGVSPESFQQNQHLSDFFRVLSTNVDANSRPFVSTIEGRTKPIYGAQWHPERPQFEWRSQPDPINHSPEAIEVMQWIGAFFVGEARKNSRSFNSQSEEEAALIYQYRPVGTTSYQAYLF